MLSHRYTTLAASLHVGGLKRGYVLEEHWMKDEVRQEFWRAGEYYKSVHARTIYDAWEDKSALPKIVEIPEGTIFCCESLGWAKAGTNEPGATIPIPVVRLVAQNPRPTKAENKLIVLELSDRGDCRATKVDGFVRARPTEFESKVKALQTSW